MPKVEVITRELLEKWVRDAETGEVYSVTSESRLLRLCGALLAGDVQLAQLRHSDGCRCFPNVPVHAPTRPARNDGSRHG